MEGNERDNQSTGRVVRGQRFTQQRRVSRQWPARFGEAGLQHSYREHGSIALYFAIIALAAFAMLGLVVDGGQAFAGREQAADLSTQAARAGADALTPTSVRGLPTDLQADPAAARAAADTLVAAAGAQLDSVGINGDQVTVTVTVQRKTAILSAVGVDEISQTASATATAVYGGTTPYGGG